MDYKFETRCIHRDNEHEEGHPYGSVCTPIYQTATFYHPGIGQTTGFNYTRESNPTRTELEDIVISLEEAKENALPRVLATSCRDIIEEYMMVTQHLSRDVEGRLVIIEYYK